MPKNVKETTLKEQLSSEDVEQVTRQNCNSDMV